MDALQMAEAVTQAITSRDAARVGELCTPDAIIWHSYDRAEQSKADSYAFLSKFFAAAENISYENIRRVRTENGFVQQHVLVVRQKDGVHHEPRPVCIVAEMRDGLISRIDEYIEARRV